MTDRKAGLTGDVWGGLAAMLVAIPSAIAYGVITYSPLGADYVAYGATAGLLGVVALGLISPALGGAPRLITAPCAPAAAVMAALAVELTSGGVTPAAALFLMMLTALLSGVLQTGYGLAGGGKLIKYIPYPVVAGYLTGVGLTIMLSQLPKLFGYDKHLYFYQGLTSPQLWKWPGVVVAIVTMTVMVLGPRLTKKVPPAILGMLSGVGTYFLIAKLFPGLHLMELEHNKLVIGPVGGGLNIMFSNMGERFASLKDLHLEDLQGIAMPAITLSILLCIDTLKTCVVLDALTRSRHESNRELLAQGAGNIASALIGGMPGAGTSGPTFVNVASGGTTKMSGVFEGLFALAAFLALGSVIGWVPIGALAGILMVVGFRMIDRASLGLLKHKETLLDFGVIIAVVAVALGKSLIAASATGLALATVLFLRLQMQSSVVRRKIYGDDISSRQHRLPEEKTLLEEKGHELVVCELQGSLFFGTADRLYSEIEPDLKTCRWVILDMRRVQSVDFTAAHRIEQLAVMLHERGGELILSHLPASLPTGQDLQRYLKEVGLVQDVPSHGARVFDTLGEALEWVEDRILEQNGMTRSSELATLDLAEIPLLRDLDAPTLEMLRQCVEARSFKTGEAVFHRKDTGDTFFLIRSGRIRIALPMNTGKLHHLVTIARGDFFGEIAFLDHKSRTADAIAETPVELYSISRDKFNEVARKDAAMGALVFARVARELAHRLRHTDKSLRRLQDS